MSNSTVALPNRHYFYNGKSTVHLFVMFTNKNFITSTFYFRWWHNPACFTFKLTVQKLLYRTLLMGVSNAIEAKLYFFWKIVHNIESFIFSNGVLLPFGKKKFFLCLHWPPPNPNIFHYFVCLGFDSGKHDGKPYPQLKISIHVHKLSSKQFSVEYQNISTLY